MMTMTMMMMTMMLTKYDDGCGDADGDDEGADHQHAHDNDGDNGDDDDADGDVDNDDKLMMMIISNLNDDIFRTTKEDAEVAMSAVVMSPLFFAPELREHIALFLPSLRGLAFVNRDWNNSVLQTIINLRNEFNNGIFQLDWLIAQSLSNGLCRPVMNPESQNKKMLSDMDPTCRWWYNVQLHLHGFWAKYVERNQDSLSVKMFFEFYYGRRCRELFPDVLGSTGSFITVNQFFHLGFLKTRDMGCAKLGRSVKEVFGTLVCMETGSSYCHLGGECGCTAEDRIDLRNFDFMAPRDSDSDQDSVREETLSASSTE